MTPGLTGKLAPLALVPMDEPPVDTVYQEMVFPDDVAFKFEVPPAQMVAGEAVTGVGAAGEGLTVTVIDAQVVVLQPPSART